MKTSKQTNYSAIILSTIGFSMLAGFGTTPVTQAHAEKIVTKADEKSVTEEEAKKLLYQAPEATALTKEGEKELKKHYVEKYMPVEGCSLVEELPKTSNIHYTPPKPKPKPKPKVKKVEKTLAQNPVQKSKTKQVEKPVTKAAEKKEVSQAPAYSGSSVSMTAEERLWLERLVEAESGGEPYEGRLAVATVIANRIQMSEFPNTVMEVITAPKQFSPFIDGSVHKKTPSPETKRAVAEVFDNGVRTLPADTAYFCTTEIAPRSWIGQTRPFVTTIGNHSFYLK